MKVKIIILIIISLLFTKSMHPIENKYIKNYNALKNNYSQDFPDKYLNKMSKIMFIYGMNLIDNLKPGDMLITNDTPFSGIAGHSAIVLNKNEVLHIPRPYTRATVVSPKEFKKMHNGGYVKVYRMKNLSKAREAGLWAKNTYKNSDAKYKITMDLSSVEETYCSKLVWQAYYYGVGKNIVSEPMQNVEYGLRLPYSLPYILNSGDYEFNYIGEL